MHTKLAPLVALFVVLALRPVFAQGGRSQLTAADARACGQAFRDTMVAAYGRIDDPDWNRFIGLVVERLRRATAFPGLQIDATIIGDTTVNAASLPGGFVLVNVGLLRYASDLAKVDAPTDQNAQVQRMGAYVAAVLGHELAHVTLGHVVERLGKGCEPVQRTPRQQVARDTGARVAAAGRVEGFERELRINRNVIEEARYSQQRELDADRVGALYLLRGGWEIQTAMDFWRASDSTAREEGSTYRLPVSSYVSSHPRAATREAYLERFRGGLKLDQSRYDDALTLIRSNTDLDAAIALLDTVLTDFPDLIEARHAHATAYHQKWLNTVPIQRQQVRGTLLTYVARFLPGIRGAPGDAELLQQAEREYQMVLAVQVLPYTMSNLAVLEAYEGRFSDARDHAQRALQDNARSGGVLNNLGVVQYLSGDYAGASATFERLVAASGEDVPPAYVFNYGRSLAANRDPRASQVLEQYLTLDQRSDWRRQALTLLGRSDSAAPTSPAPQLVGLTLGASYNEVTAALGRPGSVRQTQTGGILRFATPAVAVVYHRQKGVVGIVLVEREAGAIEGLRVGDALSAARARWGRPAETSEDGTLFFDRGGWYIAVQPDGDLISWIGIEAGG